ncbi:bifunctional phosphopantothenoylcysteine decarboxylase/phosphopantothenate synthase [Altererythrobacter aquiaggeris]|uniref:bifunctional phosphopantothenoylcysteine decarboxylase/phosphopantothenate synthase n=1 Tax=Aestuarierythrobacter aquiaggeris TaxID=1898396 RepID=UPI0030173DE2
MSRPARILLVIGGGIAAYKSCELIRLIKRSGSEVSCVLTNGGAQFVTPMTLAALSENPVHTTLWDLKNEAEMGHIQLSREADLVVVCPATADLLAKMASGIADDLATTLILATDKPVMAVPAMNVRMWQHEATQRNVGWLRQAGVTVIDPDEGAMACGEFGPGRLPEPEAIWLEIADFLTLDPGEAGEADIEEFVEALEPEDDSPEIPEPRGGLGGMLSSIISRSMPRRIQDDEIEYDEAFEGGAANPEALSEMPGEPDADPDWPDPDWPTPDLPTPDLGAPMMAKKGAARSAPPTDPQAINHEVANSTAGIPEALAGEPEDAFPEFDPLEGQPDFEDDPEHRPLFGKHVLVTAGPTHEPIDPVRYIANRSSGRQGYSIAAAAAAAGARVTLVSGPVTLATPPGVDRVDVESAEEMAKAVKAALPCDVAVMVAAVSDWRTKEYAESKMKKRGSAPPALLLRENPDILANLSASDKRPALLIGFAAETDDVVGNAKLKRKRKGVDWIIANDVSGGVGNSVMGGQDNLIHIVTADTVESLEEMPKPAVARALIERIAEALNKPAESDDD